MTVEPFAAQDSQRQRILNTVHGVRWGTSKQKLNRTRIATIAIYTHKKKLLRSRPKKYCQFNPSKPLTSYVPTCRSNPNTGSKLALEGKSPCASPRENIRLIGRFVTGDMHTPSDVSGGKDLSAALRTNQGARARTLAERRGRPGIDLDAGGRQEELDCLACEMCKDS